MKTKENAQLHSLATTRDKLVKQRTALTNKIHNVLNSYGIKFKKESLDYAFLSTPKDRASFGRI